MSRLRLPALVVLMVVTVGCASTATPDVQPDTSTVTTSTSIAAPIGTVADVMDGGADGDVDVTTFVLPVPDVTGRVVDVDGGALSSDVMERYFAAGGILGQVWSVDAIAVGVPRPDDGFIIQARTGPEWSLVSFIVIDSRSSADLVAAFGEPGVVGSPRATQPGCVTSVFDDATVSDCVSNGQHVVTIEQPAQGVPTGITTAVTAAGQTAGVNFGDSWEFHLQSATPTSPSQSRLTATANDVDNAAVTAALTAQFGAAFEPGVWVDGVATWTLGETTLVFSQRVTL